MRWMKIVATTAALSVAGATLPATAQAGHKYGSGYGYKPYHHKNAFVHRHRRSHGDAVALGLFGLAAGAILGGVLAQPRYPRQYYSAPAYAPVYGAPVYAAPGYGAPPVGSPDWYAYCASKYRSFDPSDGTFQPYRGPRRLCQ